MILISCDDCGFQEKFEMKSKWTVSVHPDLKDLCPECVKKAKKKEKVLLRKRMEQAFNATPEEADCDDPDYGF